MTGRPNRSPNWVPYAGLLLAVAGIVYQGGQLTGDVRSNTDRITKLEASLQSTTDATNSINERTARIEAKLDFLIPKDGKR